MVSRSGVKSSSDANISTWPATPLPPATSVTPGH
jgi:hypothetical protein